MKHCVLTLAAVLVAAASYAQGTINFNNRVPPAVDARVFYAAAGGPQPADGTFVAQLYTAAPGGTLAANGAALPFRNTPEAGKGYWVGESRTFGNAGDTAQMKVVAWASSLGATFEEAQAKGLGGWGESTTFTITTGGGLNPPAIMNGLTTFNISTIVPEPSIAALGLLGAGLLLIRRKK